MAVYYYGTLPLTAASVPSTSYSNTGGSGNRTGSITVTEDTSITNTTSNIVNGSTVQDSSNAWLTTGIGFTNGQYIKFDFGSAQYIDEFKSITGASYSTAYLGIWDIQGSTDDATWITQASGWSLTHSASVSTKAFTPTTNTGFRYWRMLKNTTEADGTITDAWWVEMEFKIATAGTDASVNGILDYEQYRRLRKIAGF